MFPPLLSSVMYIIIIQDDLPLRVASFLLWHSLLLISILRTFQLQFCTMTPGQRNAGMSLKIQGTCSQHAGGRSLWKSRSVHNFAQIDLSAQTYSTFCTIVLKPIVQLRIITVVIKSLKKIFHITGLV